MDELRDVVPIGEHALLDRTVHRTLWDVLWQDEQRELAEFETIEKKLAEFHEPAVVVSGYPKERLMGSDSAVDLVTLPYQEAPLENERDTAAAHATKVSKSSVNMEEGAHIQRRADEEEKVHAENDVAQDVTSEDQSRSNNPLFDDSTFMSLPEDVSHIHWSEGLCSNGTSTPMKSFFLHNSAEEQLSLEEITPKRDSSAVAFEQPKIVTTLFPGLCKVMDMPKRPIIKETSAEYLQMLKKQIEELMAQNEKLLQSNVRWEKERTNLQHRELQLKSEKTMFEKYKADQELVIQTLKDKELKTLRREQLLWDKQKKAADILPSKKERTEIDTLKQQMMDIQDAAKQKEVRLVLSQDRMKRRADSLAKRNAELLEEIKVLEQDRALYVEKLFSLRDSETRVKKAHMASQTMLENTVPSLVKAQRKVLTIGEPCITEQVIEWVEHLEQKDEEVPVAAIHPPSRHAETDPSIWALDDLHKNLHLTSQPLQELCHANGKRERFYDGLRLVWYPNETVKEAYESGRQIIYFKNGDKKQIHTDGSVVYWYWAPKIIHTTFADGLEVYEFGNGQVEKHFVDGSREILFPDKTVKHILTNGEEESFFTDGRIQSIDAHGHKRIRFPDGSQEMYLESQRTRTYPDGMVKTVFLGDGRQETTWPDGRRRVKNAQGKILLDLPAAPSALA